MQNFIQFGPVDPPIEGMDTKKWLRILYNEETCNSLGLVCVFSNVILKYRLCLTHSFLWYYFANFHALAYQNCVTEFRDYINHSPGPIFWLLLLIFLFLSPSEESP